MKTIVLGLGNPILKDDGVGLHVAKEIQDRQSELFGGSNGVEIDLDYWGGLRLMEHIAGFECAVIIDAISTGADPGTIHVLSVDDIPTQHSASGHDVNLPTALKMGRAAGFDLPEDKHIILIGVETEDGGSFDENLTPRVRAAIPKAVQTVMSELNKWSDQNDIT
jgi:hydrogenase maturation protease